MSRWRRIVNWCFAALLLAAGALFLRCHWSLPDPNGIARQLQPGMHLQEVEQVLGRKADGGFSFVSCHHPRTSDLRWNFTKGELWVSFDTQDRVKRAVVAKGDFVSVSVRIWGLFLERLQF
jgi:hypothetical protein